MAGCADHVLTIWTTYIASVPSYPILTSGLFLTQFCSNRYMTYIYESTSTILKPNLLFVALCRDPISRLQLTRCQWLFHTKERTISLQDKKEVISKISVHACHYLTQWYASDTKQDELSMLEPYFTDNEAEVRADIESSDIAVVEIRLINGILETTKDGHISDFPVF